MKIDQNQNRADLISRKLEKLQLTLIWIYLGKIEAKLARTPQKNVSEENSRVDQELSVSHL